MKFTSASVPHWYKFPSRPGDVVYEPGERPEYVYFPTTAVVSLVYAMADGATAEMGLVGNEGMVGVALFLGGERRRTRQ